MLLRRCAVVLFSAFAIALTAGARAQAPITALPRPPGDTDPVPQAPLPDQQQPAPQYAPYTVHPITSLPKPPGSSEPTPPTYVPPTPQPVAVPEITSVPATIPATAPTSIAAPATPPPPSSQPTYPVPSLSTSTPHDAPIAVPQPTPTTEAPLHATLSPEPPAQAPTPPLPRLQTPYRVHPFSTLGIQFKASLAGIGFDIATPLAQHFNLRAGGSIFSYAGTYNDSGNAITGSAQFRSGSTYIEYFPWSRVGLHLNAGIVFNGNYLNGTNLVKAGSQFDLGDGTYYSSLSDPVHGKVKFDFGKTFAPSFLLGFGNIIPRSSHHFSFPFEIGFMYVGYSPNLQMTLLGTVCDSSTPPNCQKIDNDPEAQADLKKQLDNINSKITFLKFYPIISQGFAIKF